MLVDPKHSPVSATGEHSTGSSSGMDFFNQKMEEIGQDLMMRKMGMLQDILSLSK